MWGLAQDRVAVFNQEKTCALAEHWLTISVTRVPGEEPLEVPGLREDPGLASGNSKVSVSSGPRVAGRQTAGEGESKVTEAAGARIYEARTSIHPAQRGIQEEA